MHTIENINKDSLLVICKKTGAETWRLLLGVSVTIRDCTREMLKTLVFKLSMRAQRTFNIKFTLQVEALIHFFLRKSIKDSRKNMILRHQQIVDNLLMDHLNRKTL